MDKIQSAKLVYATPKSLDDEPLDRQVDNKYRLVSISLLKHAGKTIESLFKDVRFSGCFDTPNWITAGNIKYRVTFTGEITSDVIMAYIDKVGFPEYVIHDSHEELEFLKQIWEARGRTLQQSFAGYTRNYYTDGVAIDLL